MKVIYLYALCIQGVVNSNLNQINSFIMNFVNIDRESHNKITENHFECWSS